MWKAEEKVFILQNLHMRDEDIAAKLNKSLACVRKMRQRLGKKKKCGRPRHTDKGSDD